MTGAELFEALSFVDGKYIQEAETANLGRNTPWMKVLSVAACLCILLTGAYALSRMQSKGTMESMAEPEAAAPEAMYEEAAPTEAPAATEAAAEEEIIPPYAVEEKIPAGELQHIPYVRLRITNMDGDSFDAIVEECDADTDLFEAGQQVTVILDSTKVPDADAEVQNDLRALHTDAQIEITDGAYDAGLNVLYAAEVSLLCRDGQ